MNSALQAMLTAACSDVGRVAINSTFGLFGLFGPAARTDAAAPLDRLDRSTRWRGTGYARASYRIAS